MGAGGEGRLSPPQVLGLKKSDGPRVFSSAIAAQHDRPFIPLPDLVRKSSEGTRWGERSSLRVRRPDGQ